MQAALSRADSRAPGAARTSTPSLSGAAADKAAPFVDGCLSSWTAAEPADCFYGDRQAKNTVLLLGDSHAAQWTPAMAAVATDAGSGCRCWARARVRRCQLPVFSPYLGRDYTECADWLSQSLADVRTVRPQLVVLDVARHYGDDYHFTVYSQQWDAALAHVVRSIRAAGSAVLVLGPIPKPPADVPTCLSGHSTDATSCVLGCRRRPSTRPGSPANGPR